MNGPELLKKWRKSKGLTQDDAALKLDISKRSYCRYERSELSPPKRVAKDIARRTFWAVPADSWE